MNTNSLYFFEHYQYRIKTQLFMFFPYLKSLKNNFNQKHDFKFKTWKNAVLYYFFNLHRKPGNRIDHCVNMLTFDYSWEMIVETVPENLNNQLFRWVLPNISVVYQAISSQYDLFCCRVPTRTYVLLLRYILHFCFVIASLFRAIYDTENSLKNCDLVYVRVVFGCN